MCKSIYGGYAGSLEMLCKNLCDQIETVRREEIECTGRDMVEFISSRIKSEESMREKCVRKGLSATPETALTRIYDAIGIRIICGFLDDVYSVVEHIRNFPNVRVVNEKDYIRHSKPNGYRSYHMIIEVTATMTDILGHKPGHFYAEIQLRTIAMDSWASLEHQLKYKKNIRNQSLIVAELKRCADEMASTDVSMQTIRDMIDEEQSALQSGEASESE